MDNQPINQPPVTVEHPQQQNVPVQTVQPPSIVVPTIQSPETISAVENQNRMFQYAAFVAVLLLFTSIFFNILILTKLLLLVFAIFAIVYIAIDYTKNKRIVKSFNQQQNIYPVQPVTYQLDPNKPLLTTTSKEQEFTALKALKITALTAGALLLVVVVFPLMTFLLLMTLLITTHQSSG